MSGGAAWTKRCFVLTCIMTILLSSMSSGQSSSSRPHPKPRPTPHQYPKQSPTIPDPSEPVVQKQPKTIPSVPRVSFKSHSNGKTSNKATTSSRHQHSNLRKYTVNNDTATPKKAIEKTRNVTKKSRKYSGTPPRKTILKFNRTVPCPPHFKQLFLWDAVNDPASSSWFNVSDLLEVTTDEETEELEYSQMNKNRIFYLTSGAVQRHLKRYMDDTLRNLTSHQFEYPNPFNKQALDLLLDVTAARAKNRKMAVFKNARVTGDGLIMNDASVCQAVRNGGGNASMASTLSYLSYQNGTFPLSRNHSRLITLANFAQGSWHFPMELMVALAYVNQTIIEQSKIHVKSSKDKAQWLNLLGISMKQVVVGDSGTVMAETLYAPQMAAYSKPSTSQLYWLRERVFDTLKLRSTDAASLSRRKSLVLVQRKTLSDNRALVDFGLIKNTLKAVASLLELDFIIHQRYSQFNEQFGRFTNAAIVVAPHGAAELFINFAPSNLCLIELMSSDEPLCYAYLAYLRGQDYFGVPRRQAYPRKANMTLLSTAIRMCSLRGKAPDDPIIPTLNDVLAGLVKNSTDDHPPPRHLSVKKKEKFH